MGNLLKRVELHIHTKYSYDCTTSLEDIVKTCVKNKTEIIAITDHNEIQGALDLQQKANLKVIIGEEIMTQQGEIIGLFIKKYIPPGLTLKQTIRRIKEQEGIVYLPHPFDNTTRKAAILKEEILKNIKNIDIVEIFNGRTVFPGDNVKAEKLAFKYHKNRAVGEDAHTCYELGRTYLEMPDFNTPKQFLLSLEKAKIKKASPLLFAFLLTKWARFKKSFKFVR